MGGFWSIAENLTDGNLEALREGATCQAALPQPR